MITDRRRTTESRDGQADVSNFTRYVLTAVLLFAGTVILLYLLWRALDVFLVLFGGLLFGIFLTGSSGWIRKHTPLSHRGALLVVVVALLLLFTIFVLMAAPGLIEQMQQLVDDLGRSFDRLEDTLFQQLPWIQNIMEAIPEMGSMLGTGSVFSRVTGVLSTTFGWLTNGVIILFTGLFLAYEPDLYVNGLLRLVSPRRRHRLAEVFDELAHTLRWWLIGRLASMLIVGVLSVIGLLLLGIPLALILGVLAGLLAFIPILGPTIALVPPVLVAMADGPQQALYVLILFLGIQIVESYLLTPIIQRRAVHIPPVLLIASQTLFGLLAGILGIALATPIAATGMVLVKMLYVEDKLHDPEVDLLKEPEDRFEASGNNAQRGEATVEQVQKE